MLTVGHQRAGLKIYDHFPSKPLFPAKQKNKFRGTLTDESCFHSGSRRDCNSDIFDGNQGWVVRKVDKAIHGINLYPADSVVCFVNTYPLDSDLSSGLRYPPFEQLGPGFDWTLRFL